MPHAEVPIATACLEMVESGRATPIIQLSVDLDAMYLIGAACSALSVVAFGSAPERVLDREQLVGSLLTLDADEEVAVHGVRAF